MAAFSIGRYNMEINDIIEALKSKDPIIVNWHSSIDPGFAVEIPEDVAGCDPGFFTVPIPEVNDPGFAVPFPDVDDPDFYKPSHSFTINSLTG